MCKQFYLGTLDISQKPVYTAHATKNLNTNTPAPDKRGKSMFNHRKPEGDVDFCREHIKSFPSVESHYCRSHTNRTYLGSHLTISKMYNLYVENCKEKDIPPAKKSMYYRIFATEFNLGFHIPKSDRCDVCEAYKVANKVETLTEEQEDDFQHHQLLKTHMRESRKKEKDQKEPPVLLFDLQNVIMTPHADISSLFYLRKLNIYNLTAYFTVTKKVYCALWPETLSGRAGNDLASAIKKILDVVVEENELTEITLWSDSCVPQNRNSIMSNAILDFIRSNPHVQNVTVKYSLPGHSCVQEVDNAHSQIEKAMRATDFYSPIGLIRILKSVSTSNPYKVIQMKESDFKDFAATAKLLNYKTIPFTKTSVLVFTQQLSVVQFKSSHDPYEPMNAANVRHAEKPLRRRKKSEPSTFDSTVSVFEIRPKVQKKIPEICDLKKKDIKRAFPFMPLQDRDYYKVVLKLE